jgi:hypothetical protein
MVQKAMVLPWYNTRGSVSIPKMMQKPEVFGINQETGH